jgi:hypothetical protein
MARTHGPWAPRTIAALLLAAHALLLLATVRRTSITVDEAMNVAAGVSYWQTGRFFLYRVNPPLAKMLAVLPALAAGPETDWSSLQDDPAQRAEFWVGLAFTNLNRATIFDLVCLSRLMGIAWSVLGGWLIFHWTRELHGRCSGFIALVLWCIEPYVLGHAALVTTDVPAAVAGLVASYTFWKHLRAPSFRSAALAGVFLGIASLTKFTLLALYPLWALLWSIDRWGLRAVGRRPPGLAVAVGQLLLTGLLSLNLINLGYGCQGTGASLRDYLFVSQLLTGQPGHSVGNRFSGTWLGPVPVPLPEDFLRGIDVQRVDFEGTRSSYLAGSWRRTGWWYYYLYSLAVKEPLATLALLLWGLVRAIGSLHGEPTRRLDDLSVLAPAGAILALVSSQVGYTQHSRYIIPALPYLMINAGRLAGDRSDAGRRWERWLVWGLLAAAAASSLRIYPHSLSYFNEAAGGPLRGHEHLVDSNIDWGQDLLYLKEWLKTHPEARPLGLAYFNFYIDPGLAGVTFDLPPPGPDSLLDGTGTDPTAIGPRPGYYAISVNFLRGCEFPIADGRGGFRQVHPREFEYFRAFRPIACAGYSIYIYHITAEQADDARQRMGLPLLGRRP